MYKDLVSSAVRLQNWENRKISWNTNLNIQHVNRENKDAQKVLVELAMLIAVKNGLQYTLTLIDDSVYLRHKQFIVLRFRH